MSTGQDPKNYSSGLVDAVPVIRGTRVPLWELIACFRDGRGLDAFLADHPQVTPAQAMRAIVDGLEALAERRREVPGLSRGTPADTPVAPPRPGGPGSTEEK
ncbi:MAG TPA: DUF433 domain-containing protein [Gemmatimonadales bacterium]|nr:DUF433 domain-containing protein [Gemmatimonadales bacterium]